MKKASQIIIMFLFAVTAANGQVADKAFGLNLYGGTIFGMEANYQHQISELGMLDCKAGYGKMNATTQLRLSANYDFVIPFEKNFNFYAGPGLTVGYWSANISTEDVLTGIMLNATVNLGAEYYFEMPLKISFVIKPEASIDGTRGGELTGGFLFSYYIN